MMSKWTMQIGCAVAIFTSVAVFGTSMSASAAQTGSHKPLLALKAVGNRILDTQNQPVLLRGVNVPTLEWTNEIGGHVLDTVNVAIRDWKANIIRLPLAQDRWFGKAPEQKDQGTAYRALVHQVVQTCSSQGCYILLDLHWSDCGEWGTNIGQHSMPDRNSIVFWKDCAAAFKNQPAVLFDLYNEPHDVSWEVWFNGGTIKDRANTRRAGPARTYEAVGMQQLLDTVRSTGAKNAVIAGGLDWAYDFSGILNGLELFDKKGNGVIYANHVYNNKGDTAETWIAKMDKATARLPVIVSEFGGSGGPHRRTGRFSRPVVPGGDDWLLHVMQALVDHQWSWTAWCLHPFAGPTLISDWKYMPTPDFGVFVKQALAGKFPRYTQPVTPQTDADVHRPFP
jgi:hypothetical protein